MFYHYLKIRIPPNILAALSTKLPIWIATLFMLDRRNKVLSHVWQNTNHAMEFDHNIDWKNVKILKVENNNSKRLVSEAWFINSQPIL